MLAVEDTRMYGITLDWKELEDRELLDPRKASYVQLCVMGTTVSDRNLWVAQRT